MRIAKAIYCCKCKCMDCCLVHALIYYVSFRITSVRV